jgi:hypothetical protein
VRHLRTLGLVAILGGALIFRPHSAFALDCSNFPSQAEAQAHLRTDPTDPDRIDLDGDGLACENLPGPYDLDPVPNPIRGTRTPVPQSTATPRPQPEPEEEPAAPEAPEVPDEDVDDSGDSTSEPEPEATSAPAYRSPLLGPAPPPLSALQPARGGPQFAKPPSTTPEPGSSETPTPGGLGYVQGSDTTIGAVVMQRATGIIQPPNTGDGGLLR